MRIYQAIIQNRFSVGSRHVINPLRLCASSEPEKRLFYPLHTPHPAHYPLSLDVNVTSCCLGTFACVAVSGGEVCLFCVTQIKNSPPPSTCVFCCVIWSLALTFTSLAPSLSDGAACSLCQEIHGNMSHIQPTASPTFSPLLHHHNYLKRKKKTSKQSLF